MPEPGIPTLEQLRVFLTVVEAGSFTAAAKRLGRAVSAVSYTIGNLEQQLGVSLFDREGSRTHHGSPKPALPSYRRRGSWRSASTIYAPVSAPCSRVSKPK